MSVIDTVKPISKTIVPNIDPDGTLSDILTNQNNHGTSFNVINLLIFLAGVTFFINTIIAGWNYMFSAGDPKKASIASTRLINGFVGLVIVIGSFLIVRLVSTIIGFQNDPLI